MLLLEARSFIEGIRDEEHLVVICEWTQREFVISFGTS